MRCGFGITLAMLIAAFGCSPSAEPPADDQRHAAHEAEQPGGQPDHAEGDRPAEIDDEPDLAAYLKQPVTAAAIAGLELEMPLDEVRLTLAPAKPRTFDVPLLYYYESDGSGYALVFMREPGAKLVERQPWRLSAIARFDRRQETATYVLPRARAGDPFEFRPPREELIGRVRRKQAD